MRGEKRRPTSSAPSSPFAFSPARLAVVGGEVGSGGVRTRRKDIRATGAQSCATTVPEHSYVMDR